LGLKNTYKNMKGSATMFCMKCGTKQSIETQRFCGKCGEGFSTGEAAAINESPQSDKDVTSTQTTQYTADYFRQDELHMADESIGDFGSGELTTTTTTMQAAGKYGEIFASPKEKLVSVMGNSYAETFLANGLVNCGFVILSDKRAYMMKKSLFLGFLAIFFPLWNISTVRHTVDIEDITETGFNHVNPIGLLIFGILAALTGIVFSVWDGGNGIPILFLAAIIFYLYFKGKQSLYRISFGGGNFTLKMRWLKKAEVEKFERDLRMIKDSKREGAR
jgi:hypothetical protein